MGEYQFSPLSSATSVRLLVLQTPKGQGISTTWFSLEEIGPKRDQKYEALSYTCRETTFYNGFTYQWNESATIFFVNINDSVCLITKNLAQFLQHLAQSAPDGNSIRRVWANQKDIHERNSQVAMMKDIYSSSRRTLIWLGTQDSAILVANLLHAITTPHFDYRKNLNGVSLHDPTAKGPKTRACQVW